MQKPSTSSKKRTPKAIQNAAPVAVATSKPSAKAKAPKARTSTPKKAPTNPKPTTKKGKLQQAITEAKAAISKVEKLMK